MLDSSYFCFITLTTIGFGDLTPDQKNTDGEVRIALCSLYLLFGIAMICMSFNLVQEEVINNVKGIIDFEILLLMCKSKIAQPGLGHPSCHPCPY